MSFINTYDNYRLQIEKELDGLFLSNNADMPPEREKDPEKYMPLPYNGLLEAMRYSLLAGGKRLRPILTLEFCRVCGGDIISALPVACAVELLHTYSLIHDDLPCMDNDELRRGKPTNHIAYNEFTAVLAGDALQAEAFGLILRSSLSAEKKCLCAEYLSGAAGVDGICGGQFMDMSWQGQPITQDQIFDLCGRKTTSLLVASCMIGAAAGGGTEAQLETAGHYGSAIGLAFQARDDLLDALGSEETLGKATGGDMKLRKHTIYDAFGRDRAECEKFIRKLTDFAKQIVSENFGDCEFLCKLADWLAERNN